MRRAKKKSRKGRNLIIVCIVLAMGLSAYVYRKQLAVVAFDTFFADDVKITLDQSYKPIGNEDKTKAASFGDPFSVLLIGADQRGNEPARSDSLIYSVIRPKDNRMLLLSIPRDAYTNIVGYGKKSKINAAYAFGGAKMSVDTVEKLLGQPVKFYASVNFKGLVDIVNELGGVQLPIQQDIVNKQQDHEKFTIKANKPIYSGKEALNYVRYREDSDFKRTERHRIFIGAILNRFMNLRNISKIDDVMKIGGKNLNTNMNSDYILRLAKSAVQSSPQITNYMLKGSDSKIDGVYYYILDKEDLKFANGLIQKWLSPNSKAEDLDIPATVTAKAS